MSDSMYLCGRPRPLPCGVRGPPSVSNLARQQPPPAGTLYPNTAHPHVFLGYLPMYITIYVSICVYLSSYLSIHAYIHPSKSLGL